MSAPMPAEDAARLSPDMTMEALMQAWPPLVAVLLHRRMACPGCAMAPFMTLREAAEAYGLDIDTLMAELGAALDGMPPAGPFAPPLPHAAGA